VNHRCSTCGTDFDDSLYLFVCPHFIVERPALLPDSVIGPIDELILDELSELWGLDSFTYRLGES